MIKKLISRTAFKLALPLLLIAVLMTASGCVTGSSASGWSGVAIGGENIYFGSASGEVVALSADNGMSVWQMPITSTSSGGFGCGSSESAVALYGTPAVDGELVYIAAYNGKIYALNTVAGSTRWVYPREGSVSSFVGGPVLNDGKLYIASLGGIVYALDAETGDLIWQYETDDEIWTAPAVDGSTLYVGTFSGKLYAIDTATGDAKWQEPFETDGPVVSTPLLDSGTVYAASFDRHIYALNSADGRLIWQFPGDEDTESKPERWFWASPVLYNGVIYAPNMDGKVYILNAADGSQIDTVDLEAAVSSTPVIAQSKLFVATEEGGLFYISIEDNEKYELPPLGGKVTAPLTADGSFVYVHSQQDEVVYVINAETATRVWNVPVTKQ